MFGLFEVGDIETLAVLRDLQMILPLGFSSLALKGMLIYLQGTLALWMIQFNGGLNAQILFSVESY